MKRLTSLAGVLAVTGICCLSAGCGSGGGGITTAVTPAASRLAVTVTSSGITPGSVAAVPPEGSARILADLTTAVGLTPAEQAAIQPILDAMQAAARTACQDQTLTPVQIQTNLQNIRDAAMAQIRLLLTSAQQTQFDAWVAATPPVVGAADGDSDGQAGPPGGVDAHTIGPAPAQLIRDWTARLALTRDQQTAILPLLQKMQQDGLAVINDTTLTPAQKHTQLDTIRTTAIGAVRALLTPAQQTQFDALVNRVPCPMLPPPTGM